MAEATELARWASTVLFVVLALVTGHLARRRRHPAATWAFITFTALGLVTVLGRVLPDDAPELATKLNIILLAAFPWALFHFAATFGRITSRAVRAADVAVAGLAVWALLLPELPGPDDDPGAAFQAFVLGFVVIWVGLLAVVGVSLWRGGRGEPTLTRRRMRLLALGSFAMGLAVIGAAYAPTGEADVWPLLIQLVAVLAAVGFLIGFMPPPTLRVAWRQPEERELYTSAVKLLSATHPDQIASTILPSLSAVVGARAAWIVDAEGEPIAMYGQPPPGSDQSVLQVAAGSRTVHVWPSRYAPFFGDEEERLLRRLALLSGLGFERAEALEQQRAARAEAEAANQELEAFVYSASHDLKSPLIAMLGYLGVLDDEYRDQLDDQLAWYLERMKANGTYMEALINDLLELSRVGRAETDLHPVALGEVAVRVAEEVAARHPAADIRVGALPVVWFNEVRARQLLTNLVENACRYAGREDVRVDVRTVDGGRGEVRLVVSDNGVGIPEEYRERIFGVFERLAPDDDGGTGIGLAICAKIAAAAGGSIAVADTNGGGASFVITLPAAARIESEPAQEATL